MDIRAALPGPLKSLYDWCFNYYGSSRSSALIRICFALIILYRYDLGAEVSIRHYGPLWYIPFYLGMFGMLFGVFTQLATLVVGVVTLALYYYFWVILHQHLWMHHHTYILSFATILLSLAPCGKSFSIERWFKVRQARAAGLPEPQERGNLYALRLLAIQMAVLYFFAFWDKMFIMNSNEIFWDFLNGNRLEQIILHHYFGSGFVLQPWMGMVASALAVTVCVLELVLPLLLIERFQKWLVIPGMGLHIAFYVLLPLQTYSLTCIVLYLSFFNADKVHALIDRLGPDWARVRATAAATAAS